MAPSFQISGVCGSYSCSQNVTNLQEDFTKFTYENDAQELVKNARLCFHLNETLQSAKRLENVSWRMWYRQHRIDKVRKCNSQSFANLSP